MADTCCAICGADDELLDLVDTDAGPLWVCHDCDDEDSEDVQDWEEFCGIEGDD